MILTAILNLDSALSFFNELLLILLYQPYLYIHSLSFIYFLIELIYYEQSFKNVQGQEKT